MQGFGPDFNIGYIFIRHTALEFVQAWRDACFGSPTAWDQHLFASVLRRGGQGPITPKNLLPMFRTKGGGRDGPQGRRLLAGVLPVALFASGHTFFVTRMAHVMRRQPYMVHTTFQCAQSTAGPIDTPNREAAGPCRSHFALVSASRPRCDLVLHPPLPTHCPPLLALACPDTLARRASATGFARA